MRILEWYIYDVILYVITCQLRVAKVLQACEMRFFRKILCVKRLDMLRSELIRLELVAVETLIKWMQFS